MSPGSFLFHKTVTQRLIFRKLNWLENKKLFIAPDVYKTALNWMEMVDNDQKAKIYETNQRKIFRGG